MRRTGYAISREEELSCIVRLAREEGIVTDPVYTGKTVFALTQQLKAGHKLTEPIVFLHTGGVHGLHAKAAQVAGLL